MTTCNDACRASTRLHIHTLCATGACWGCGTRQMWQHLRAAREGRVKLLVEQELRAAAGRAAARWAVGCTAGGRALKRRAGACGLAVRAGGRGRRGKAARLSLGVAQQRCVPRVHGQAARGAGAPWPFECAVDGPVSSEREAARDVRSRARRAHSPRRRSAPVRSSRRRVARRSSAVEFTLASTCDRRQAVSRQSTRCDGVLRGETCTAGQGCT